MRHLARLSFFFSIYFAISSSWGQDAIEQTQVQWGLSTGFNSYKEPDLMQLKGPEIGMHSRINQWAPMPLGQFEGDILLGRQNYDSKSSGSMSGVTNLETRWRALFPLFSDSPSKEGFFSGLAYHTLWNDLRGTSTFQGTTYGGYQRSASQLWLPVRWSSGDMWEIDAGMLIYGRHTSKLSEVNTGYKDIVNTQRRGQYAQVAINMALRNGESLKPFVRFTHLADSNTVAMGGKFWVEPESNRWQTGIIWEFSPQ